MEIEATTEFKEITYNKTKEPHQVFKIPLDKLIYNKYNGRIRSIVKSYESGLARELDPKDSNDSNIIENYLFDSAEYRNEKTSQSLKDYGQQEIGIVTKDMIIIDGNRRAMLLKKLYKTDKSIPYFKAIILPDNLQDSPLEIIKLETNYQMGVDNKVEYKPIEKYLRCQELVYEYNVEIADVAKLMSEKPNKIEQWLEYLKLMEEYLNYLKSPKVYTRLDKTEGHFIDLFNYLKKHKASGANNFDELKKVYFDYIRLGLQSQRLRVIGNPNNSMSLFSRKEYWPVFNQTHENIIKKYSENNFHELKLNHPDKSNEEIFNKLDTDFRTNLDEDLKSNLVSGEIYIKSLYEKKSILIELNKILKYLNGLEINENVESEKNEIKNLLEKITVSLNSLNSRL